MCYVNGDEAMLIESHNDLYALDHPNNEEKVSSKYIIICNSRYNRGETLYYTGGTCGRYWSLYRNNAVRMSLGEAQRVISKVRLNNPRIVKE